MVPIPSLWLGILVGAVLVFVVSSIIHMVLPYHRSDFRGVPDEDAVMDALRKFNIAPGEYIVPHAGNPAVRKSPEFQAKAEKGPVLFLNVFPSGMPKMGTSLMLWFVYCLIVGVFAAYVAGRTMAPEAEYLAVFRIAGTVAFAGYGLALMQSSIWYKRAWGTTGKSMFDAFIYALLTAGALAAFWP
ncbi:MAG: hypothetical protein L0271_12630 [Gemmatimonadetes bacterium]|nr:hypothetical protein [Gemmatimonadota bacterium]